MMYRRHYAILFLQDGQSDEERDLPLLTPSNAHQGGTGSEQDLIMISYYNISIKIEYEIQLFNLVQQVHMLVSALGFKM